MKKARDSSPLNGSAADVPCAFGHLVPRPVSLPLPTIPHERVGVGPCSPSGSASSVSQSGSDGTPDLSFYIYRLFEFFVDLGN